MLVHADTLKFQQNRKKILKKAILHLYTVSFFYLKTLVFGYLAAS